MKPSEKEKGSYPEYLKSVEQCFQDAFANAVNTIDRLLKAKYSYYIVGSFYDQLLITSANNFEYKRGNGEINPCRAFESAILQALSRTCGVYNMMPSSIAADRELCNAISELQSIYKDTVIALQLQDAFDELKGVPISNN